MIANNLRLTRKLLILKISGLSGTEKFFLLKTAWHFGDMVVDLSYREAEALYGLSKRTLVNIRRSLAPRHTTGNNQFRPAYLVEGVARAKGRNPSVISRGRPRTTFQLSRFAIAALLQNASGAGYERPSGRADRAILKILSLPRSRPEIGRRPDLEPAGRLLLATLWCLANDVNVVHDLNIERLGELTGLTAKQAKRQLSVLLRQRYLSQWIRSWSNSIPLGDVAGMVVLNEEHKDLQGIVGEGKLRQVLLDEADTNLPLIDEVFALAKKLDEIESSRAVEEGSEKDTPNDHQRKTDLLAYNMWHFASLTQWDQNAAPPKAIVVNEATDKDELKQSAQTSLPLTPLAEAYRTLAKAKPEDKEATTLMICRWASHIMANPSERTHDSVTAEIEDMVKRGTGVSQAAREGLSHWLYSMSDSLAKYLSLILHSPLLEGHGMESVNYIAGNEIACFPSIKKGILIVSLRDEE